MVTQKINDLSTKINVDHFGCWVPFVSDERHRTFSRKTYVVHTCACSFAYNFRVFTEHLSPSIGSSEDRGRWNFD